MTVISVTDEDLDTVTSFLDTEANDDLTYREITAGYLLSADPDGSVSPDSMEASGQGGIPTAISLGRTGGIEWMGHPFEHFKGRAVRVTGVISLHRGRPQIVVQVPGQIELLPESVTPESSDPGLAR